MTRFFFAGGGEVVWVWYCLAYKEKKPCLLRAKEFTKAKSKQNVVNFKISPLKTTRI